MTTRSRLALLYPFLDWLRSVMKFMISAVPLVRPIRSSHSLIPRARIHSSHSASSLHQRNSGTNGAHRPSVYTLHVLQLRNTTSGVTPDTLQPQYIPSTTASLPCRKCNFEKRSVAALLAFLASTEASNTFPFGRHTRSSGRSLPVSAYLIVCSNVHSESITRTQCYNASALLLSACGRRNRHTPTASW